jgi:VWFA-related protein
MHLRLLRVACLALPLSALAVVHAQSAGEPAAQAPQAGETDSSGRTVFRATARTVVVDVVVTDSNGEPVANLPKDGFQILENGASQKVTFFEEHTGVPADQSEAPQLPPNVYTNVPRTKLTDSVNVLLVDSLNTPMSDQSYVHSQTLKYLKNAQPGTRIAIFALSTRLRFVQGFTADAAMLKAALNNPKLGGGTKSSALLPTTGESAGNAQMVQQIQSYQTTTASSGYGAAVELQDSIDALKQFQADTASFQLSQRIEITLDAMQQLGRYLAGIPGRKNVIWFAGSFPLTILPQNVVNQNGQGARQSPSANSFNGVRDFDEKIRKTTDLLTSAQVAIYPVAAKGVTAIEAYSAESQSTGLGDPGKGKISSSDPQKEAMDVNATRNSMEQIAHDSGGQAFFSTNDLGAAIAGAINNGTRFYTLSYTPTDKTMDGTFRRIEVKLAEGKYRLSYRRGYYTQDPKTAKEEAAKRIDDPLHPFMGRGMPDTTQIPFTIQVVPTETQPIADTDRTGDNKQLTTSVKRYAVTFNVPTDGLLLPPADDGTHHAGLEVALVAYDYNGKALNWMVRSIELNIKPERWAAVQQTGIPFRLQFDVPQGDVYLRTGVYDNASTRAGTIEIPLTTVNVASK